MATTEDAIDRPAPAATHPAVWLGDRLAAEQHRLALWLPVLFGAGIGSYFALPVEPPWWTGAAIALIAGLIAFLAPRGGLGFLAAIAVIAAGLGMGAAQWRVALVAAPVLAQRFGPAEVSGRVVSVELRPDEGRRMLLDRVTLPGLLVGQTPEHVRIRLRTGGVTLAPGERVAVRAVLLPPPAPAAPGAYDFQRQAWFERLGAVGYATGPLRRTEAAPTSAGWRLWLNDLRQHVQQRIMAAIPGPAGAVAAALLTGEAGAIPEEVNAWMRDSGLAHILSISGLHIGLVAGIVFFGVRGLLALIPPLALRWPIKKWAAVAAFAAITFYTLFASTSAPTVRSWLMTSIVLFAVVIDRAAISMRLVAWAAFAILVFLPESMLGPSFQMSFAAVVALIAAYEVVRDRFAAWRSRAGFLQRRLITLAAISLTTLVAGTASAPFALYHFNRFTAYGLAANFLAVPLTSIWIMPWLVIGVVLIPFGLDHLAWVPMGWGVDWMIAIAREVASWDGAVALLPEMPAWGLVAVTLGGLWLCLWRTRWRLWGVPAIAIGLASVALYRGPDILASGDARLVAVRGSDGLLQLSDGRASRLTRESWLRRAGQEDAETWPQSGPSEDGRLTCDALGCIFRSRGHIVALSKDAAALVDDCRTATIVVAVVPIRRGCASAAITVDRFDLWRDGGHALWLDEAGTASVESVRAARGERPWVVPLPKPRERPPAAVARGEGG
jgi:competence protein ComEC